MTLAGDDGAEVAVGEAPVPRDARRILVYGGTFDPPHRAHVELPPLARDAVGADWLLYIPAGGAGAPLREGAPGFSSAERTAMLQAALRGAERISISTIETAAPDPAARAYTIDTIRALRGRLGSGVTLRLLVGADQAAQFHNWRDPRALITLAEPAVMLRPPLDTPGRLAESLSAAGFWNPREIEQWRARAITLPVMDISATRIRELLHAGKLRDPELERALPAAVLRHLRRRTAGG